MEKVIAFLDYELDYATQLAAYLNAHRRFPYQVLVFAALPELKEFLQKSRVEALVAAVEYEKEAEELAAEQGIKRLFYFTEQEDGWESAVYRFQSAERIRRLLQGEEAHRSSSGAFLKVGVFSPVPSMEKERFARAVATAHARKGRTLFVPLEPYGSEGKNEAGGFSEAIFYIKQHKEALPARLRELVREREGYACLGGVRYAEDLFSLKEEELRCLFEQLGREGVYDTAVCDIGLLGRQSVEFLAACNVIYIPVFSGEEEKKRQETFMRQLKETGDGVLLERIVEIQTEAFPCGEQGARGYAAEAEEALRKGEMLLGGAAAANL